MQFRCPDRLIDQALAPVQRTSRVLGFAGDVGINRDRIRARSKGADNQQWQ